MRTLLILSVHNFLSEETDKFEETSIHGNNIQKYAMKPLSPSVYSVGAGRLSNKDREIRLPPFIVSNALNANLLSTCRGLGVVVWHLCRPDLTASWR